MEWLTCFLCIFASLGSLEAIFPTAERKGSLVFRYPRHMQSERDLDICDEYRSCSMVRMRFWLPLLIERQCRCKLRSECSWTWSKDNNTVSLDNMSQLKFCSPVTELPRCADGAVAVVLQEQPDSDGDMVSRAITHRKQVPQRSPPQRNITTLCRCNDPHYWAEASSYVDETGALHRNYTCAKLSKCDALEFCGHIRVDHHATYYRCSCPEQHMCIARDKTLHEAEELLYSGPAYRAQCFPVS